MTCLEDTELASLEAGTLEGAAETDARAHLRTCERCDSRREDLVGTVRLLGGIDAAEIAPPPALWEAVAARIDGRPAPNAAVTIACAYCKGKLARVGAVYCAACIAPHHEDCWDDHGRCASCSARERVKASVSVKPARRPRRGWLIAVAGALAGAGGVAAIQGGREASLAPPSARGKSTPPGSSPFVAEPSEPELVRKSLLAGEPVASTRLYKFVEQLTLTVGPSSPATEVNLLAKAALELLHAGGGDEHVAAACSRVLAVAPENLDARLARARHAVRWNDYRTATEDYAKVVALAPKDDALAFERFQALEWSDEKSCRVELDRFLAGEREPKWRTQAQRMRAHLLESLGEPRLALADRVALAEASEPEKEDVKGLVSALVALDGLEGLARYLDEALARRPSLAWLWLQRGVVRERALDFEGALAAFDRAKLLNVGDGVEAWARLLALRCHPDDIADELEAKAERPLTLGDLTADVGAERSRRLRDASNLMFDATVLDGARFFVALGRIADAENQLTSEPKETDASFADHEALLGYVWLMADEGKVGPDRSRRPIEAALAAKRNHPLALAGLATVYHRSGDPLRARSLFQKAREMQGASSDPEEATDFARGLELAHRARLTSRDRDRVLARRAFARVIYRNPLSARAYFERARLAKDTGHWDAAVADVKAALRVDPYFMDAWLLRIRLHASLLPGKPDPKTLRPLHVRDSGDLKDAVDEARSRADGAGQVAEVLVAGQRYLTPDQWRALDARIVQLTDEVAPVFSGKQVAVEHAEHARLVLSLASWSNTDADRVKIDALRLRFAARGAELVAEARTLLEVAHDPWSALERLELAGKLVERTDGALDDLVARCRAALPQVEER